MAEKLEVVIGADASELVRETKKADKAFSSLADSVTDSAEEIEKAAKGGRDAFGRFVKATEAGAKATKKSGSAFRKLGNRIKDAAKRLKEFTVLDAGRALVSGFKGLVSIVSTATKAIVGLGVALAGIGTAAAVSFAKFQAEFAQVRTLVDESVVDVARLEDGVRRLSREFGVDLIEATRAAYNAISAGQDPATVVGFLEESFRGAAAGAASTGEAVDLFTTVLNAFGKSASETTRVSDILFATIKAGKTTAGELAASLGQVVPIAATAGVSLEEVGGALATLTASGLNTAEATTALKAAFVGILKPSGDAAKNLKRIGIDAASLKESGFVEQMAKVREAVQSGDSAVTDFFPNIRALGAASTLAGLGFEKLRANVEATTNSAGEAAKAYSKVEKATATSFNRLRRTVEDTFRQIGKVLDPFVKQGLDAFTEFASGARKEVEALGNVLARKFAPDVADAFGTLESAAGESGDLASRALELIADGFNKVGDLVRATAPAIATVVTVFETLSAVVRTAANAVKTLLGGALLGILAPIGGVIKALSGLASVFGGDVADSLKAAEEQFDAFFEGLAEETGKAAKDTSKAFGEIFDVADNFEKTEKAVSRFGLQIKSTASSVRGLTDEVDKERVALTEVANAAFDADQRTKALAESTDKAATAQAGLGAGAAGAATQVAALGTASSSTATSVESLVASFAAAGAGSVSFTAQLKTLAAGVASIGSVQTGEQALASRQAEITALIAAADANLASAVGAARDRAQKLNAEAQANLSEAKKALGETKTGGDEGEIADAGRAVAAAAANVEATIARTNQAFNDQRAVATEAFNVVRDEIGKVAGAQEVLRDATIATAKEAAVGRIKAAQEAFSEERAVLLRNLADRKIDQNEFREQLAERRTRLSELTKSAESDFKRIRAAAKDAFELGEETQSVQELAAALTGEFADAVTKAKEDAEAFGTSQEELNKQLLEIVKQSKAAGDAVEESGEAAEEAGEGYDKLKDATKEAGDELVKTATKAEIAAAKILKAAIAIAKAQAQAASFARTGVGVRPGGETQSQANSRLGAGSSSGFGFGLGRNSRSVGRVNVGEGVFHDGGSVNQTGRPNVEAGEFVLSQRGLSDLGRTFADMLNKGRGGTTVNQTNNFSASSSSPAGDGEDMINELAFKLRPALFHTGRLAAAQSPVT